MPKSSPVLVKTQTPRPTLVPTESESPVSVHVHFNISQVISMLCVSQGESDVTK